MMNMRSVVQWHFTTGYQSDSASLEISNKYSENSQKKKRMVRLYIF